MATGGVPIEELGARGAVKSALTAEEKDRLVRLGKQHGLWPLSKDAAGPAVGCGILIYLALVLGSASVISRAFVANHQHQFLAVAALVGMLCWIFVLANDLSGLKFERDRSRAMAHDAAGSVAYDLDLDIARAVEIEEYEDEGAGFFLELADGRVLCLISQDLYEFASDFDPEDDDEDRRGEFPQTRIRYRYAPNSGMLLDLTGIGEPLRPIGKIKTTGRFFRKDKETGQRTYTGPEDGMVYEGPLEASLAAFGYKLKPL